MKNCEEFQCNLGAFEAAWAAKVSAVDQLVAADVVHGVLAGINELLERLAACLLRRLRYSNLAYQPTELVPV